PAAARRLGLPARGRPTLLAAARTTATKAGRVTLRLRPPATLRSRLAKARRSAGRVVARLTVRVSVPGGGSATAARTVRIVVRSR
ncbi:hypothetical protein VSS74_31200, partial [Conexibacter stalactiti]